MANKRKLESIELPSPPPHEERDYMDEAQDALEDFPYAPAVPLDRQLLVDVLSVQTASGEEDRMQEFIKNYLKGVPMTVVEQDPTGNIYVTKDLPPDGQFYPCIVAHMDTVHDILPDDADYQVEAGPINDYTGRYDEALYATRLNTVGIRRRAGIGGDDKVGVAIALQLLSLLPYAKLAFFVGEETYCAGSFKADLDFFDDCAFILQADRRDNKDFVRNANGAILHSEEFSEAVESILYFYEYEECNAGLWTDVWALHARGVGICLANISCGYYRPHSDDEFVVPDHVEVALNLMRDICLQLTGTRWEHPTSVPDWYRRRIGLLPGPDLPDPEGPAPREDAAEVQEPPDAGDAGDIGDAGDAGDEQPVQPQEPTQQRLDDTQRLHELG